MLLDIAIKICNVFEYLHSNKIPIIYQDLKPDHIIINKGNVKLVDFGYAFYENEENISAYGSIGFFNPKLKEGYSPNISSDIYSIGALLYFLKTSNYISSNKSEIIR